jgi:hypothetical protein
VAFVRERRATVQRAIPRRAKALAGTSLDSEPVSGMYGRGMVVRGVRVVEGTFDGWAAGVVTPGVVVAALAVVDGPAEVVVAAAAGGAVFADPAVVAGPVPGAGTLVGVTVVLGAAAGGRDVVVAAGRAVVVGEGAAAAVPSSSLDRTTATVVPAARITKVSSRSTNASGRLMARTYPKPPARPAAGRVTCPPRCLPLLR